jgi:hypothetical protein
LCCSISISIDWPIGLRDFVAVARFAGLFFAAPCFADVFRAAAWFADVFFADVFFAADRPFAAEARVDWAPRPRDPSSPPRPLAAVFLDDALRVRDSFTIVRLRLGLQGALAPSTAGFTQTPCRIIEEHQQRGFQAQTRPA